MCIFYAVVRSECIGGVTSQQASMGVVKQPHDMADVLLSLKHAVVHPGQISGGGGASSMSPPSFATNATYPHQSQLSYAMHPHQVIIPNPSSMLFV